MTKLKFLLVSTLFAALMAFPIWVSNNDTSKYIYDGGCKPLYMVDGYCFNVAMFAIIVFWIFVNVIFCCFADCKPCKKM